MNQQKTTTFLLLLGAILFHFLFWEERAGLNILLFYGFIMGSLLWIDKERSLSKYARYTLGCTLLVAISVVINNSQISKVMFWISFWGAVGCMHQKELSFFGYSLLQYFLNLKNLPLALSFRDRMRSSNTFDLYRKKIWRFIKIAVIPIIIVSVFFQIYTLANPYFAQYSERVWNWLPVISFDQISFGSIFFFLLGFVVVVCALWRMEDSPLVKHNNTHTEQLLRQRKGILHETSPNSLRLKSEYRTAILLMVMLNILLLFVNAVDLNFVWFNFEKDPNNPLKSFVHEGTYLLIVSILLASAVIVYYFRGNLNFYKQNKNLRLATYGWIFQNVILALSVGMRNYRYVEYHGLAHLRVGVFIFLIAVIYGLYSVYKKVKDTRSFYYLMNRNTWVVYILLVLTSLVNWDVVITRYNIAANTIKPLHITFLAESSSDKNLFLLKQNTEEIIRKLPRGYTKKELDILFEWKEDSVRKKGADWSWLSWNYADYRNLDFLKSGNRDYPSLKNHSQ